MNQESLKPELMERRRFLGLIGLSAALLALPGGRALAFDALTGSKRESVAASIDATLLELVNTSERYEPNRVYALENRIPGAPVVDRFEGGNVSFLTEKDLTSELSDVVMRRDMNYFASFDGQTNIPAVIRKTISIDPHIQGSRFHWGYDLVSKNPDLGTIMTAIFRGRVLSEESYSRLWPHATVTQLIDRDGNDIVITLFGQSFHVLMNYGHLHLGDDGGLPVPGKSVGSANLLPGTILEVGAPIGDTTRQPVTEDPTQSFAHTHVEMLLIPVNGQDEIAEVTAEENGHPDVGSGAYLDWSLFLKFLPGDMLSNMGKTADYMAATKDYATRLGFSQDMTGKIQKVATDTT
jgi:hypothetical protein